MTQLKLVTQYCIDTSTLINLKEYPIDIFPSIWDMLKDLIKNGQLISHIEAYKEINHVNDDMSKWCKQNKKIFKDLDNNQIQKIQIIKDKYDINYWNVEISKVTPWADPWIISVGMCENAIVVADESNKPNKIPFVCNSLSIKCLHRFDFFRELNIRL